MGCLLRRSQKCQISFFFFFYLPLSFWLFSFLSQPFSFMIQKSLVNIPARQFYWALQCPPSLVPSTVSVTRNFLLINLSPTITYSDLYILYVIENGIMILKHFKIVAISFSDDFQNKPYALILCLCRKISTTTTYVLLKLKNLLLWLTHDMETVCREWRDEGPVWK